MHSRICIVAAAALWAVCFLARGAEPSDLEKTATAFLQDLDHQDYGAAWQALHPAYQKLGSLEKWRANIERARTPLGHVQGRKLDFLELTDEIPNLGPDKYMVLRFEARFEQREAMEIVVLKPLEQGWGVAGYGLR
jgi:hypothetical protein